MYLEMLEQSDHYIFQSFPPLDRISSLLRRFWEYIGACITYHVDQYSPCVTVECGAL